MRKRATIGIDLGGTKTMCGLFDEKFEVLKEIKFKTQPEKGEKKFTEALVGAVRELVEKAHKEDRALAAVGIGCAGYIKANANVVELSPNIPFLKGYSFDDVLGKIVDSPILVANDAHAGLYGEQQLGAAADCCDVIGIFLGTGIGGALMIGGKLHYGASGSAGELGAMLIEPTGAAVESSRAGRLNEVASRSAIAGEAAALAAKQWAPHLYKEVGTEVAKIRSGTLAESVKEGDKHIEELIRSRARMVGIALSNIVNFLSPQMVILAGGMVEAMPTLILKEVETEMWKFLVPSVDKTVRIAVSKLKEHAITAGAAKMAFDRTQGSASKETSAMESKT